MSEIWKLTTRYIIIYAGEYLTYYVLIYKLVYCGKVSLSREFSGSSNQGESLNSVGT